MVRLIRKSEILSRGETLRLLLAAPHIAHVSQTNIEAVLDHYYSDEHWEDVHRLHTQERQSFVSYELMVASNRKLLTGQLFSAEAAIPTVMQAHGRLCCLCLTIDNNRMTAIDPRVVLFVIRDPIMFEESEMSRYVQPFCDACSNSYGFRIYKKFHSCWKDHPDEEVVAALHWLYTNTKFQKRVRENAGNAALLRFDPRKRERIAA